MRRPIVVGLGFGLATLAVIAWRPPETSVAGAAIAERHAAAPIVRAPAVERRAPAYDPQLLEAIHTDFGTDDERTRTLRVLLERSGKPTAELVDVATRFQRSIGARSRIREWKCYRAGCFFRAEARESSAIVDAILAASDETAPLSALTAVVSDGHEHQLVVVLTEA